MTGIHLFDALAKRVSGLLDYIRAGLGWGKTGEIAFIDIQFPGTGEIGMFLRREDETKSRRKKR